MKLMQAKLFTIVAVLSIHSLAFGYNFGITNKTREPITVVLNVEMSNNRFVTIQPNKKHVFLFKGSDINLCLKSIQSVSEQGIEDRIPVYMQTECGKKLTNAPFCGDANFIIVKNDDSRLIALCGE
jgi:hypothetical protein